LCYGEYVVFRNYQGHVTIPDRESYALADKDLQKYQFPRSLKHLDSLWDDAKKQFLLLDNINLGQCPVDRSLREDELSYYQEYKSEIEKAVSEQKCTQQEVDLLREGVKNLGEEGFLRTKFIQYGLDIYFIPKTLYELFILKVMLEKEIDGMSLVQYATQDETRDCLLQGLTSYNYKLLERQASAQCIRYTINKELFKLGINQLNPEKCKIFVQQFMNDIEKLFNDYKQKFLKIFKVDPHTIMWKRFHNLKIDSYNEKVLAILQKAIDLEYEAHEKGYWVLYRGINFGPIESGVKEQKSLATGVCYGHSLLAGCLNDGGSCALNFIISRQYGYASFVNIANYYNPDSSESKLFRLPAIDTVEGLVAQGETFHPRTRVESYDGFWADEQQFKKYLEQHAKCVYLDPQEVYSFGSNSDDLFYVMIHSYTDKAELV